MKIALKNTQEQICEKYYSPFSPLDSSDNIAIALSSIGKMPITGMRNILAEGENISWFIFCGEQSSEDNFFQPVCVSHLDKILPQILPYLALAEGFNFIIDDNGYEDVWQNP